VAILGSIGAVSYGSVVVNLIPTGMSPDAAHAAMETLGGAVASAQQLQQSVAVPFLNAAREAFHNSLRLVAATSAVIMLACAAVLTVRWKIRNAATSLLRARE
jgi:DHA2 family multidrug resistance protein-like MFS transporter